MHAVRWEIPSSDLSEQSAIIHRDPERSRKAILDVIKESFAKNTLQQPFHNRSWPIHNHVLVCLCQLFSARRLTTMHLLLSRGSIAACYRVLPSTGPSSQCSV